MPAESGRRSPSRPLGGAIDALTSLSAASDDAGRIDRIRQLEELKNIASAMQAAETAAFAASQERAQAAAGILAEPVGRGVAAQVALARRISPHQAHRYTGWARILVAELPATFAQLASGAVSEWRAMIVARETAWLTPEHRADVDAELAPKLPTLGDRQAEAEVKRIAYRLDPSGYRDHVASAAKDRRVTARPAPDLMCRLSALLPVAAGVAAYAALTRAADAARAAGDARGRGQVMADTLVERVTGQAEADQVPVEIHLVMTDRALLGDSALGQSGENRPTATDNGHPTDVDHAEPTAELIDYGPIPSQLARRLVFGPDDRTPRWIRRLYRDPTSGELIAMDSRRRRFTAAQRRFVTVRDRSCRMPWCDAPVRHVDHIVAFGHGGPTSVDNAQGLCEACNYAKQAAGWRNHRVGSSIWTTTPTGHLYESRVPAPPGAPPPEAAARSA